MKVLFICKQREATWSDDSCYNGSTGLPTKSSGLYNSVRFVSDALLKKSRIVSKIVDVADNNEIDREITLFKPDVVIIEAFWVVPEKFEVLMALHRNIKFIVRMHSEVPFAATEGVIFKWIAGYLDRGVILACNSERAVRDIRKWVASDLQEVNLKEEIIYLPNIYPATESVDAENELDECVLDVGCFGAIRPFKNILSQAIAAISVADDLGKPLNFHINGSRLETNGNPVLANLIAIFDNHPSHRLVKHPWYNHTEFMKVIARMDLGTQVSFTETFNIVAADFACQGVPIVVSKEIKWAHSLYHADPTDIDNIKKVMKRALFWSSFNIHQLNKLALMDHSRAALKVWIKYFK